MTASEEHVLGATQADALGTEGERVAALVRLLQVGFRTIASRFASSSNFYDNVELRSTLTKP